MRRLLLALACLAVPVVYPTTATGAPPVELAEGDIVVMNVADQPPIRELVRVDPLTGETTTISSGGLLEQTAGIEVDANGDILVAAGGTPDPTDPGGVIRVDPATGTQTRLSSGELFVRPADVAIEADGDIIVVAQPDDMSRSALWRLNPVTGAETAVSAGGSFVSPRGVAIEADGNILVADADAFHDPDVSPGLPGGVIRVDPTTGAQTTVSAGGSFADPLGIALEADGNILVAELSSGFGTPFFEGGIIRVDPATGAQTTVSSLVTGDALPNPRALAVEADGSIVAIASGGLRRVDPVTGDASFLAAAGHLGVAVVPPLPPAVRGWIGLKNSDDQGTQFDLMAELLKNGAPVASGLRRCITGVTRNPALATRAVVRWDAPPTVSLDSDDTLSIRLSTRIGTNPNGTRCSGPGGSHASATGLRLYYDSVTRRSSFDATIEPDPEQVFYLHSDGNPCRSTESTGVTTRFFDSTPPSAASAKCKDSAAVRFAGGNALKVIGTWNLDSLP